MMMRIAKEKTLPFEPLIPDDETTVAMRAAQRSEFAWSGSADKLLAGMRTIRYTNRFKPVLILIYRNIDPDHLDIVRIGSHSELGL